MEKKFIVTGGAGFIGSNIVSALNAKKHEDILIVDLPNSEQHRKNLAGLKYCDFQDITDFRNMFRSNKLEPVNTVFHMGACSSTTETDEKYLTDNNFNYTRELCEWCLRNNVRFIYASSAATYGDGSLGYSDKDSVTAKLRPLNLYGKSKHMFDMWALTQRLFHQIVGIKYFNVYGPREDHKGDMRSVVNKAYKQIVETGTISLFKSHRPDYEDGEQTRDFVYVKDAVNVTLFFHDHPEISGLFNCGTGQARTWLDLAHAIFAAMQKEPSIKLIDMPEHLREKYQYHTQADISKLRQTGYDQAFTSIEDGVQDYVRTYLATRATMNT